MQKLQLARVVRFHAAATDARSLSLSHCTHTHAHTRHVHAHEYERNRCCCCCCCCRCCTGDKRNEMNSLQARTTKRFRRDTRLSRALSLSLGACLPAVGRNSCLARFRRVASNNMSHLLQFACASFSLSLSQSLTCNLLYTLITFYNEFSCCCFCLLLLLLRMLLLPL